MNRFCRIISILLCIMMIVPMFAFAKEFISYAENTNTNIALGKSVFATKTDYGQSASNLTDGNTATYWDGGVCPSEATVNLDGYYKLSNVNVVPLEEGSRYYYFTVYGSDDGINYNVIGAKEDNKISGTKGFDFATDITVRFVKVKVTFNSENPSAHLSEIRIYGTKNDDLKVVKDYNVTDPNDKDNIAFGKATRANSNDLSSALVVDGDISTSWTGEDYPKYVDVDLMANYDITSIKVFMPKNSGGLFSYDVYGSLDGVNYTRITSAKLNSPTLKGDTYTFDSPINYRIIRVNVTSNSSAPGRNSMVSEIKVYGKKNNSKITETRKKMDFSSYDEWMLKNCGVDTAKIKDGDGRYNIEDTYTEEDTFKAINGLITRILGEKYTKWFTFELKNSDDGFDYYELSQNSDGTVNIKGNEGVSITTGLNYFLKYYCNVQVSQQTSQVNMPESIPKLKNTVSNKSPYEVRYAYNYCTLSYTMAFFGYDEWQRELDYLALNGINLILDTTATEAMWVYYLQELGYTADQAKDFVCGYAYKAWWLMGNLENYGGSVSDSWIYDTLEMARKNERFMTLLGMQPCLQGFMGTLPNNIASIAGNTLKNMGFQDISSFLVKQGEWCGFERPIVLLPDYDGYDKLADMFYCSQDYIYGQVTDYYCGDICHEGGVMPTTTSRAKMSAEILDLMMKADPDAVWIIQAWWGNPTKETLEGFGEYREDHILVLDLTSSHSSTWKDKSTYGGKEFMGTSWVFCMLDNYGGRTGMHGALKRLNRDVISALKYSQHMKGIGITPEGTQQNPVVYELFWELSWTDENIDITKWIKNYVTRRYGEYTSNAGTAWDLLVASVYGYETVDGTGTNTVINNYPVFGTDGVYFETSYSHKKLESALNYLMADFDKFKNNESYIYDVVDIMRQVVTNSTYDYYEKMEKANKDKDYDTFVAYEKLFLEAIKSIDEISSYQKDTLLGTWVGRVDSWVNDERNGDYDDYTVDMMKINAKALITVWSSASLANYAYRSYSGLMNDYYYNMWETFLSTVERSLKAGNTCTNFPSTDKYYIMGWNVVIGDTKYTTEVSNATGDNKSRGLQAIYGDIIDKYSTTSIVVTDNIIYLYYTLGTVSKKAIADLTENTTVNTAKENIKFQNGTLAFTDPDGDTMNDNDLLYEGCVISLIDEQNKAVDAVTVTGISYSDDTLAALDSKKADLQSAFNEIKAIDTKGYTEEAKAQIESVSNKISAALENTNLSAGIADAMLIKADNVKAIAVQQDKIIHDKTIKTVIIITAVFLLAAVFAGVVIIIRKKSKLKSKLEKTEDKI